MPLWSKISALAPIMHTPETDAKSTSGLDFAAAFQLTFNYPLPQIETVSHSIQQHT